MTNDIQHIANRFRKLRADGDYGGLIHEGGGSFSRKGDMEALADAYLAEHPADAVLPWLSTEPVTLDSAKALGFREYTDTIYEHPCGIRWLLPMPDKGFKEHWRIGHQDIPTPTMGMLLNLLHILKVPAGQETGT